jgi:hypothetical protein
MTGAWSRSPFGRVVRPAELGALGKSLAEHRGEARRVCILAQHRDWIFKEYSSPMPAGPVRQITQLIELPGQLTAGDRAMVDGHTAWPVARVVDDRDRTIGVLAPLAPDAFSADRPLPGGRTQRKVLEVDVLALTETRQAQIKVPPQPLASRIAVCASVATIGALFERNGLVYLDWSYANVFWSLQQHTAYVIDLDGCSFGPRPQIETPNWEDPLVPRGQTAGNQSDRYRMALLTARCLTGKRANLSDTRSGLLTLRRQGGGTGELAGVLIRALNSKTIADRPSISEIRDALETAKSAGSSPKAPQATAPGPGGVRTWKPLAPPGKSAAKAGTPVMSAVNTQRPPVSATQSPRAGASAGRSPAGSSPGRPPTQRVPAQPAKPQPPSSGAGTLAAFAILVVVIIVLLVIFA